MGSELADVERMEMQATAKLVAQRQELQLDSVSLAEAADFTGVSVDRLRRLIGRGSVLAFSVEGAPRLPSWQLQRSEVAPTLNGATDLAAAFPGDLANLNDWVQRPNVDLEGSSPAEALKRGESSRVLALAQAIGAAGR